MTPQTLASSLADVFFALVCHIAIVLSSRQKNGKEPETHKVL